jgi:hypothetical protein
MPVRSGVTVVTTLGCLFSFGPEAAAHQAPGIPCALCNRRAKNSGKPRAKSRAENAKPCLYTAGCLKIESVRIHGLEPSSSAKADDPVFRSASD